MRISTYGNVLPLAMQNVLHDSIARNACSMMLENMRRVVAVCLPIFDLAMRLLKEAGPQRSISPR